MTSPPATPSQRKPRIIARPRLRRWKEEQPTAAAALTNWETAVKHARFGSFPELRATFPKADLINDTFLVFNILGGFRLITTVNWRVPILYLKLFLTHDQYIQWSKDHTGQKAKKQDKQRN